MSRSTRHASCNSAMVASDAICLSKIEKMPARRSRNYRLRAPTTRRTTMNLPAILKVAMRALGRNKMRSGLTMLGIIIGVGAVIAMVSVGQGAQRMVQNQISSMGSNMLYVMPGNMVMGGASMGLGAASTLTDDDVNAIQREIPTVAHASPVV